MLTCQTYTSVAPACITLYCHTSVWWSCTQTLAGLSPAQSHHMPSTRPHSTCGFRASQRLPATQTGIHNTTPRVEAFQSPRRNGLSLPLPKGFLSALFSNKSGGTRRNEGHPSFHQNKYTFLDPPRTQVAFKSLFCHWNTKITGNILHPRLWVPTFFFYYYYFISLLILPLEPGKESIFTVPWCLKGTYILKCFRNRHI